MAPLLPQHEALIKGSAISGEVAEARGYRSVNTKTELRELGFGPSQARVPALLIPVWGVAGEIVLYQIRPDSPRIKHGKALKYETPGGARMALDVPPTVRTNLGNPGAPLFITEGARKADSAVSQGLCCVALLGVWNWRGTNGMGGKTALADWESVALNGRLVFIAFDSDVTSKPEVQAALQRLQAFLQSRGAKVRVLQFPSGPNGEKVGFDDYLAAGNSIGSLLTLCTESAESALDSGVAHDRGDSPYVVENGRICFEKVTNDGPTLVPLCNFTCQITEEVVRDNGVDQSREFVLEGRLDTGEPLRPTRIAAARFGSMAWVQEAWGARACLSAGFTKRDQLREAIQVLSPDIARRCVYTHTGWREIDGRWAYLHSGGALGDVSVEVDLGSGLAGFALPAAPVDSVDAMRTSLALLDVAPLTITAPLWAGVFRAVTSSVLPLDMALWLEGLTGSMKSTLAALFLSHFGSFDRTTLPGSWSSTPNQLERRAFALKDVLFVIDDFAPSALDRRELDQKASRLIRAQGNLSGRGRLRSDLSERPTMPPRGLILGTGEDRPAGRSILARTLLIEVDRASIDMGRLTCAQSQAHRLPHALAAFITWLAPQLGTLPAELAEAFRTARSRATTTAAHLRVPEILAHLAIGLDLALAFAEEIGAVDAKRRADLGEACWDALVKLGMNQRDAIDEVRPTRLFIETLDTLLVQGRVTLLDREGPAVNSPPERPLIGWRDDEYLYLLPSAAFQAVQRALRDAGDSLPVTERRLRRDLLVEGITVSDAGRSTATVWIGGQSRRVLRLRVASVDEILGHPLRKSSPVLTGLTGSGEER